ncbi:MAG TPA: hypothetical protein PLW80_08285, partial [Spirochaetales bacterium]|nr:hypothetical protein [Spirochaetales bacterium]
SIDGESGYASIYVNGAPNAGPLAFSGIPSDPTIRIGVRMTNSGFFQGSFDDLRVYAGALAADEIAAIRADGYFSGGRGTAASPYLVATPMDLYNVRRFPAAHFRQTADIDLSANAMTSTWAPIVGPFTGTYDGGGRSVSNVALGALSKAGSGFFEQISPGGVVRNLTMTTVSGSSSAENLGALAGIITSATISDITITGIDLTGTIYIGGLAGTCSNSALTRINVEGAIASSATLATYLGGMAGQLSGTAVSCVAAVNVGPAAGTTSPNTQQVGGFAGSIREFSDIVDCHARGNILYGGAGNGLHIGGFAGQISQQAALQIQVRACTSSGSVATNEADYVGGFSGQLYATSNAIDLLIDDCSSTSTVTAPNGQYIGGFAGLAGIHTSGAGKNRITSSRSTGTVSANGTNSGSFVGGFIGYAKEGTVIEECSSTSNVSAKSQFIGGFAGALGSDAAAVGAPGSIKRSYATG